MSSETRPTDGKHAHYYSEGEFYGDFPRLFALTDELAAKLQIVDLEIDGKTQPRATNAKLFDKLNLPAIKAKLAEDTKKQARRGGADSKGEPRKLTAAEEKQKAKERAEQLAGRITAWRHQWLKALVAAKLETLPAIRERVLIWLATNPLTCFGLRELVDAPIVRAAKAAGGAGSDPWEAMQGLGTDESLLRDVGQEVVRNVLLAEDRDPKRPNVPFAKLDDLAAMASIDLAAEWKGIQGPAAGEQMRARFESFFELFQTSQLDALGSELGVEVVNQSGKAAKVKRLASYPQVVAKTLPMPKGIKPVAARAARKGKK